MSWRWIIERAVSIFLFFSLYQITDLHARHKRTLFCRELPLVSLSCPQFCVCVRKCVMPLAGNHKMNHWPWVVWFNDLKIVGVRPGRGAITIWAMFYFHSMHRGNMRQIRLAYGLPIETIKAIMMFTNRRKQWFDNLMVTSTSTRFSLKSC